MNTETTFLAPEEIRELTEYSRHAEQCHELDRIGIKYIRTRTGRPKVLRKALEDFYTLKTANRDPEIDLSALEKINR